MSRLADFYKKYLQNLKNSVKTACIFFLILVVIQSILVLSAKNRGWVFCLMDKICDETYLLTVPKNICVWSKSKIKTKVINRRLFIHKFCNNSKNVFIFTIFIFKLFFVWVLSFFVSTNFLIHSYLVHKSKNKSNYIIIKIDRFQSCFIICFDTTKHSHVLFLFN